MCLFRLGVRRLHAEVRQDIRHHFADDGRGHLAAADIDAGAVARRVEQHEDDDLRVIRRRKADERDDVLLRAAGRVLRDLFRRAGLAADAVAGDVGVLAGAVDGVADDLLDKAGVAVLPGTCFGNVGAQYVRLSLLQPDERLAEAVKRIGTCCC